jgi:hypothetical protein
MPTAVIIEPRRHHALSFVLKNIVENLDSEWNILIFHGLVNKEYVKRAMADLPANRFLPPIELHIDNLTIAQYNSILMSPSFYQCIPTEIFLIFQTDSMILEPTLLSMFMEYDYVGAPWRNHQVGNGGFSLRRKSKMLEITRRILPSTLNEDSHLSCQTIVPLKKPPFELAKWFSVETVFHERSFGIHVPWKYLTKHEMDILLQRYPSIQTLISLQSSDPI